MPAATCPLRSVAPSTTAPSSPPTSQPSCSSSPARTASATIPLSSAALKTSPRRPLSSRSSFASQRSHSSTRWNAKPSSPPADRSSNIRHGSPSARGAFDPSPPPPGRDLGGLIHGAREAHAQPLRQVKRAADQGHATRGPPRANRALRRYHAHRRLRALLHPRRQQQRRRDRLDEKHRLRPGQISPAR